MNKIIEPKIHLLVLASGIIDGSLPNNKSNIHPLFNRCIISCFYC